MRTTQAAASDAANQQQPKLYWDSLMRNSKGREVAPPALGAPVADTHVHLDMLHHPELSLARAAAHGVSFLVTVVDPTEDPAYSYQNLELWQQQAAELLKDWEPVPGAYLGGACPEPDARSEGTHPDPDTRPPGTRPEIRDRD